MFTAKQDYRIDRLNSALLNVFEHARALREGETRLPLNLCKTYLQVKNEIQRLELQSLQHPGGAITYLAEADALRDMLAEAEGGAA